MMNWVTTNVRLPEELYMELRMDADRTRRSVAAIVRERLSGKKEVINKREFWKRAEKFAKEMARANPGVSFSRGLIEMRYEQ